jgi:hypothetical protein
MARGFRPIQSEIDLVANYERDLGPWLRNEALSELVMPGGFSTAKAAPDLDLFARLPGVAAFGFAQAMELQRVAPTSAAVDREVAVIAGAFNAAISLLDYLVDECDEGLALFELLNTNLVADIFVSPEATHRTLAEAGRCTLDPRVEVLLKLVGACMTGSWRLYKRSRNDEAWSQLATLVMRIHVAEHRVSGMRRQSRAEVHDLIPDVEVKSALPSAVIAQVAALVRSKEEGQCLARVSVNLGQVIWRIDELVDVYADSRRAAPSSLALRLSDRAVASGRDAVSDADVYAVVGVAAAELIDLLEARCFGLEPAAAASILSFARAVIASWAAWDEQPRPTHSRSDLAAYDRKAAAAAAAMLVRQQSAGYPDAVHLFPMPNPVEPTSLRVYHCQMFQRATILDALLDAADAGIAIPDSVINAEALRILQAKHAEVRGGWNYIAEFAELPPDIDDLAIVLQVLFRIGGAALACTCDEPVRMSLDATGPDGAIPTWIVDRRARRGADRAINAYLDAIGRPGGGAQPEVIANLAYGLLIYAPERYREALARTASWLRSVQREDGSWESAWYAGPYYGTYRAASVLASVGRKCVALDRARKFILGHQGPQGAWGESDEQPLATAFAVLMLAATPQGSLSNAYERGRKFLLSTQERDGSWAPGTWGEFPTPYGPQTYRSRTITTAFCLKALLSDAPDSVSRVPA